jgi:hypothetical protein
VVGGEGVLLDCWLGLGLGLGLVCCEGTLRICDKATVSNICWEEKKNTCWSEE